MINNKEVLSNRESLLLYINGLVGFRNRRNLDGSKRVVDITGVFTLEDMVVVYGLLGGSVMDGDLLIELDDVCIKIVGRDK